MSNEEWNVPKLLNRAVAASKVARRHADTISDYELALVRELLFETEQQVAGLKAVVEKRIGELQKTA